MPIDYGTNSINTSGLLTVTSGNFTVLQQNGVGVSTTTHTHGNISSSGTIGTTSGRPLITTTNGVVTTGVFGSTASTFCEGNDFRLSNSRSPIAHAHNSNDIVATTCGAGGTFDVLDSLVDNLTIGDWSSARADVIGAAALSHSHGNITTSGAIGSSSNLPVITTTNGLLTTGSFGTTANTFCQGNDSRLSDARTPISHTHASSDITNFNSSVSGLLTKTISFFTAADNQPPATNFATLDTRNSISVLEFDANTQESAIFVGVMPDNVVLTNGLTVRLWWMGDTATTGNVRWGVSFEDTGTDNDADSFSAVTQANGAANGTSGIETVTTITATSGNIDSIAAGDRYRLRVTRIADDATNDTMLGDAQLVAVEVRAA